MNLKQRQQHSAAYIRVQRRYENKHLPAVLSSLNAMTEKVITALNDRGFPAARNYLEHLVYSENLSEALTALWKDYGVMTAKALYKQLLKLSKQRRKEDSVAFGFNFSWANDIIQHLKQWLLTKAVLPYTQYFKKQLMKILEDAQANGWGIERTVTEIKNESKKVAEWKARQIVRTELAIASNFAQELALKEIPFETVKEWIAAHDERARASHALTDGKQVESDEKFTVPVIQKGVPVGVDLMSGPGDATASAGNVINCRCTLSYLPKRDKKGNLIIKK